MKTEIAIFGGGCFWCTEALFLRLRGVITVISGYAGGAVPNPMYEQVCSGTTGHAEVIKIEFDPQIIPFRDLLDIFLHTHDPTSLNRQGADMGTQYRSIVFYTTEKQKQTANQVFEEITKSNEFGKPPVTELKPLEKFYPAEAYHHDYYTNNYEQPYCQLIISPKIAHLRQKYAQKLKE